MDMNAPGTSRSDAGMVQVHEIVEELSQIRPGAAFCEDCPSDQHYFPYRCVPVAKLEGKLTLTDYPFFGFVLHTEKSDYFLILRNPMNIIASFLSTINCKVIISNALLIIEYFHALSKRFYPESFHLEYLEVSENVVRVREDDEPSNVSPFFEKSQDSVSISKEYWSQPILVLHVSSVLCICGVTVCLLFVKFLYPNGRNEDMWLILQNKKTSWSVVLFPGYRYELLIPHSFKRDTFSKYKQPLRKILPIQFHESFETMFHHPELFSTMNACYVPGNSKLKLLPPSLTTSTIKALTVQEAMCESTDFVSIFGRVTKVNHLMRQWSPWCFMCKKVGEKEVKITSLKSSEKLESVMDRFKAEPKIPETGIIFPESRTYQSLFNRRTFGVLGSLIKKLTIRDLYGDGEALVFVRDHSFRTGLEQVNFTSGLLHAGGVLPNTIVCFENLVKKTPQGGKPYYLTTPLTKVVILDRPLDDAEVEVSWSCLGPPIHLSEWTPGKVFWFPLDFPDLLSVKIFALCDSCGSEFDGNQVCRNMCPNSSCRVDATAILRVEHLTMPPFKVIMKNNDVKTFLGADDTMWGWFCTGAKRSPLFYSSDAMDEDELSMEEEFLVLFRYYCDLFRPKNMMHVCVKVMKRRPDDRNDYFAVFCLALAPVDPARTEKFAYESENTSMVSKNKKQNSISMAEVLGDLPSDI